MSQRDAYQSKYLAVREDVLKRDNYSCVKCGSKTVLEVHHVFGYENNEKDNLQTLCTYCHKIAPMGDAFFEWLKDKDAVNGVEFACDFVLEKIRSIYVDLSNDEFENLCKNTLRDLTR